MKNINKCLILEGPNGTGKDSFIRELFKHVPQCRLQYAASSLLKEFNIAEENLTLTSLVTFETLYQSVIKDPGYNFHVQYRSTATNIVYNKLFRPNASWLEDDKKKCIDFMMNKYDDTFKMIMYLHSEKALEDTKMLQKRIRDTERPHIHEINRMYAELAEEIYRDPRRKFKIVIKTGDGLLPYIKAIISEASQTISPTKSIIDRVFGW